MKAYVLARRKLSPLEEENVVHLLIPLSVPGASCSSTAPCGLEDPMDSDSRGNSGMGWGCSYRVGGTPERGHGYFPVGLKTEPGPAAPLRFSFFSSPTFTFLGGLLGVMWGFDWIPTSRGLFCSSLQGPGPRPIIALCLSQTRLGPASIPRGTWCTFH